MDRLDTTTPRPRDPNDTSCSIGNDLPPVSPAPPVITVGYYYNRKVSRYSRKHKISCKEAFKRLYK